MKDRVFHSWRRSRQSSHGFTLVEVLVGLGVVLVLGMIGLGVLSSVKRKAQDFQCLQQTRQFGVALLLFASEKNGLPWWNGNGSNPAPSELPAFERWTRPYLGKSASSERLRCPLKRREAGGDTYYSYNYGGNASLCIFFPTLKGIPAPSSRVVLAAEGIDTLFREAPSFNRLMWGNAAGPPERLDSDRFPLQYHGGERHRGVHLFFLDGHVELVRPPGGQWARGSEIYGTATNGGYFYDHSHFSSMAAGRLVVE